MVKKLDEVCCDECLLGMQMEGEKVYYGGAELEPEDDMEDENIIVKPGDDVEVSSAEAPGGFFIARIESLFQEKGEMKMALRWFYRMEDTILKVLVAPDKSVLGGKLDKKRLWLAEDSSCYEGENDLSCISRLVNIKHVCPGDPIPNNEEYDYWYNQTHTLKHYTFRDDYPHGRGMEHALEKNCARELAVMDLFSGCGGMSFVAQSNDRVSIVCKHAVDLDSDALLSFKANHPDAYIHEMGVEQFLFLCKHMNCVYERYLDGAESPEQGHLVASSCCRTEDSELDMDNTEEMEDYIDIVEIIDVELQTIVKKVASGQGVGQLQRRLTMRNSWLRFSCQTRQGRKQSVRVGHLHRYHSNLLKEFALSVRAQIPRPGDIGLIVGGPPCQGVSGFNRHAEHSHILDNCYRNAQVKVFFSTIDFFKPAFALMENVLDIFKKDDGAYAKYATGQLLAMGYQARLGIVGAGDHGVPQVRFRCFLWGALSGKETLPPFPQPAFIGKGRSTIPDEAKCCYVDFLSDEDRRKAWPATVLGDVLSDLPEISNFCLSERQAYKSQPLTPLQAWLRRDPPPMSASRDARAQRADSFMSTSFENACSTIAQFAQGQSHEECMLNVGKLALCCKQGGRKSDFASESWLTTEVSNPDYEAGEKDGVKWLNNVLVEANKKSMQKAHGEEIYREMKRAKIAEGPVRDHVPRICNSDDYVRIESVPKGEGQGYRTMEGVAVNHDGSTCAGHAHAFRGMGCEGDGVAEGIKRSKHKEGRVDFAEKDGWRGTQIAGCSSKAVFTPSKDLQCPRWCITTKAGKNCGRHQCFGRFELFKQQPTVVTRAEPHNIQICHPQQNRTVTVRENARCQGFPDYYALVGTGGVKRTLSRMPCIQHRFTQVGNAVCPQVALAIGRGLLLAAVGEACPATPVVDLPDPELNKVFRECGLHSYMSGGECSHVHYAETTDCESDNDGEGENDGESENEHQSFEASKENKG